MYCDHKLGRKEIKYLHPKMEEVLKDTCGVIAYQEEVMKLSQVLANYTMGQADILRKAMGKKKKEIMDAQKDKFINGCIDNDVSKTVALKVWDYIEKFAGYGFNKAHSAAYAYLAYQTAYLKQNYPIEFMCNLLTGEVSDEDKMNLYIQAAGKMGLTLWRADINKSGLEFVIDEVKIKGKVTEVIRAPLTALKGVGVKAVEDIKGKQPFTDLKDFLFRVDGRRVTSKVFEVLVNSGCMDEAWGESRQRLLANYSTIKDKVGKEKKERKKQDKEMNEFQGSLFDEFNLDSINV